LLSLPSCMYIYMNSNTIDSPSKHHMQYLSNHSHHPCFFTSEWSKAYTSKKAHYSSKWDMGRVWRNSLELFWGLKFSLRK
jgi:hypothetical protein